MPQFSNLKTQKARGVFSLMKASNLQLSYYGLDNKPLRKVKVLPHDSFTFSEGIWFARPCPLRPRHGFVESKRVSSWEELFKLYAQSVTSDDKDSEMIVMPALTGKNSAVALCNQIAWGRGNDGATNGKKALTIFTPGDEVSWERFWSSRYDYNYSLDTEFTDSIYLELVEHEGLSIPVQLRDGPKLLQVKNIIPRQIDNPEYIFPGDRFDVSPEALLKWETKILEAKNDPNIVVWAEDYPLSSHWLVHAIQNGVPIITDRESVKTEGESLLPTTDFVVKQMDNSDLVSLSKGMTREWNRSSLYSTFEKNVEAALTSVATLHSQHLWGTDKHYENLRAKSVVRLARFGLAACLGELRHINKGFRTTPVQPYETPRYEAGGRNEIYKHALLYMSLQEGLNVIEPLVTDFMMPVEVYTSDETGRDGRAIRIYSSEYAWGENYGGPAWANVATATGDLLKAISNFTSSDQPTNDQWNTVIMEANKFVNTCHNNGTAIDKWLENRMGWLAEIPVVGFLNQDTYTVIKGE